MLAKARIREDVKPAHLDWITALRSPAIAALMAGGAIQPTLSDDRDHGRDHPPDYPGERLIACYNPFLAADRACYPRRAAGRHRGRTHLGYAYSGNIRSPRVSAGSRPALGAIRETSG
jgi:hypothetical protein